jgi:hypothetical protein
MSKEELNSITLKMQAAVTLKHWNEHITLHSVKNALTIQSIGTQFSTTCFGTLRCHHQVVKQDPAETGAQCHGKQRRMEAVYCNR